MKEKINKNTYFFIVIIVCIAFVQIVWKLLTSFFPDIPVEYSSRFIEASMGAAAFFLCKTTNFVQPWLGIRVEKGNRRKTVITCLLIAAGITAFYITTRLILQNFIPEIAARPFFKTYIDVKLRKIYLFAVIVQELLSKGVLQHGMEKALPKEKYKTAILVTAAIFGMLHIHTSPYYIIGAMGLAVVSGIIYHKQGNIWASVTLHFFLAFLPRCFGLK